MGAKLFVGNISWDATQEDVEALFAEVGTVVEVYLVMDRVKNRHKGYGFVTMSSDSEAAAAISQLDGRDLVGREVRVSEARPREDRS